jgi:hypothetical protein
MTYNYYVKKETVDAVIQTSREKIEGKISKLPNNRLLDMLNQSEVNFIPVTDATAYCVLTGDVLFRSEFLAVNKQSIILIADHLIPA